MDDSQQTIFPFLSKSDACFGCEGKTEQEIRLFLTMIFKTTISMEKGLVESFPLMCLLIGELGAFRVLPSCSYPKQVCNYL